MSTRVTGLQALTHLSLCTFTKNYAVVLDDVDDLDEVERRNEAKRGVSRRGQRDLIRCTFGPRTIPNVLFTINRNNSPL